MLFELGLTNFKAFGGIEQSAPMSKITLIYGPNSGGKSSIIQAIRMLKQSALEAGHAATIWGLVTRGEYVDLGSYLALLHNHDYEQQLGVRLNYGHQHSHLSVDMTFDTVTDVDRKGREYFEDSAILSQVVYEISRREIVLATAKLDASGGSWWDAHIAVGGVSRVNKILDFSMERTLLPELKLLELETLIESNESRLSERRRGLIRERARLRHLERRQQRKRFDELASMSEEELGRLPPLDRSVSKARATMEGLNREPDSELIQALQAQLSLDDMLYLSNIPSSFQKQLQGVRYLGPLRSYPERLYKIPGVDSYSSGLRGEYAHHRLYYQPGLIHVVNQWFERFNIPYQIDVSRVGDPAVSGEYIALVLTDRHSGTQVTLPDVGFGINQILPIMIEGVDFFTGDEDRVLCVEQPEIHLHPRLQAKLADLILANIDGRGQKQWILETHSELLILRIQRRIREGCLDPADVSVLYVNPHGHQIDSSTIEVLGLDDNGNFIDEWPDGFFEESFAELYGLEEE